MTIDSDIDTAGDLDEIGKLLAADDATRLLEAYEPGSSFFFSSARATMLARGVDATVPKIECGRSGLSDRVAQFLTGARDFGRRNPLVVGAVPFGENLPAHLVLPREVVRAAPPNVMVPSASAPRPLSCRMRQVPAPEEYERGVARVLRRMQSGELSKVVLARSLELSADEPIDVRRLLRNLALKDPGGYTFAVDLPARGQDGTRDSFGPHPELHRTFAGASPELLVSRRGISVRSNPMAGSRPRSADPLEDRRRAEELEDSEKDLREHAAVVEAVTDALRPLCTTLRVPRRPSVVATAAMWHLATEITGELRDPDTSSLDLAVALHPTPAVCGTPTAEAGRAITENEPFDRGYYAGVVGWCDAAGDGEWVVAIRCTEVEDASLRLYAGAGVVAGSDPADELAETSAKFRTALAAMGLDHAL
ncbi:isochorismate synthase [Saccharopolyspora erythraea NRRL 2338]|uniref:isochorismate synthase n=3 Tax=Saccharopolyspora erythraea TaxID=1836 RepID=A4FGF0_SACEN|nr:isochorismate synthase DhbC [Saccharopolyspora erythraea]PFG96830.1 isochorismate synthase [Saccharopolyspora erythraea NRRL 2338]QRK87069.1 isochorismate synthase DhbC [Saccharopolyspora erythraea]CAM03125.1 isochorismate synthase [Saccharopolyspora erythraea NRRL 2338]